MPECLFCPLCEFQKTNILKSRPYSTYCSHHLLETAKAMRAKVKESPFLYRAQENNKSSDKLIDLFNEIKHRKFTSEQINKQLS